MVKALLLGSALALAVTGCGSAGTNTAAATASNQPSTPDAVPTFDPTPYPPHNYGDLAELAGQTVDPPRVLGDDDVSIGGCDKHRISILVPPSTSPQTVIGLLADEDSLLGGGAVFAYGSAADYQAGAGYTVGRLIHNDPCNADDTITVDVGTFAVNDEYTFPAHP